MSGNGVIAIARDRNRPVSNVFTQLLAKLISFDCLVDPIRVLIIKKLLNFLSIKIISFSMSLTDGLESYQCLFWLSPNEHMNVAHYLETVHSHHWDVIKRIQYRQTKGKEWMNGQLTYKQINQNLNSLSNLTPSQWRSEGCLASADKT